MSIDIQQCLNALSVMYEQPNVDPETRRQADSFLYEVQCSSEIWRISEQIQSMNNLSVSFYFYAANALFYKIRSHSYELGTKDARLQLKQLVESFLNKFGTITAQQNNVSAVLSPAQASTIVDRLCNVYSYLVLALISSQDCELILDDLFQNPPPNILAYQSILEHQPEAHDDLRTFFFDDLAGKDRVKHRLSSFQPKLMHIASNLLGSTNEQENLRRVFRMISTWSRHKLLHIQTMSKHGLYTALFQAISMPQLVEVASSCISGLVLTAGKPEIGLMKLTCEQTFQSVGPLLIQAIQRDDEEVVKAFYGLLADVCHFATPLLFSNEDSDNVSLKLFALFTKTTRLISIHYTQYGNTDEPNPYDLTALNVGKPLAIPLSSNLNGNLPSEVYQFRSAQQPGFDFLQELFREYQDLQGDLDEQIMDLRDELHSSQYDYNLEQQMYQCEDRRKFAERRADDLLSFIEHLIISLGISAALPEDYDEQIPSEKENVRTCRDSTADVIFDLCSFLSSERLFVLLSEQLALEHSAYVRAQWWRGAEALVYVQRQVEPNMTDHIEPNRLDSLCTELTSLLLTLTHPPQLATAAVAAIGSLSKSLPASCISRCIGFVSSNLSLGLPAAAAFRSICRNKPHCLHADAEVQMQVYAVCTSFGHKESREIASGIFSVFVTLPVAAQPNAVRALLDPVIQLLSSFAADPTQPCPALLASLHNLLGMLHEAKSLHGHPIVPLLVEAVRRVSPSLMPVIETAPEEDPCFDAACQVWKYALEVAGPDAHAIVTYIAPLLGNLFVRKPASVILYLASTIVKLFPPTQTNPFFNSKQVAEQFYDFFVKDLITKIAAVPNFVELYEELSEDFIGFLYIYTKHCAGVMFSNPVTAQLFSTLPRLMRTVNKYVFFILCDLLQSLYSVSIEYWENFSHSATFAAMCGSTVMILGELLVSCTQNRRIEHSTECIPAICEIVEFITLVNTPETPVVADIPADMQLKGKTPEMVLQLCLRHPAYHSVGTHLLSNFVHKVQDYSRHRTEKKKEQAIAPFKLILESCQKQH